MNKVISVLPLNKVVFPGQLAGLHIKEPNDIQLVLDSLKEHKTFGILPVINRKIKVRGIEVEVVRINKTYDNGEMDISIKGKSIYFVKNFYDRLENKQYAGAAIEYKHDNFEVNYMTHNNFLTCIKKLNVHVKVLNTAAYDRETIYSYDVAYKVGMSITQQYRLLSIEAEEERQMLVLNHCIQQISVETQTAGLRDRVIFN